MSPSRRTSGGRKAGGSRSVPSSRSSSGSSRSNRATLARAGGAARSVSQGAQHGGVAAGPRAGAGQAAASGAPRSIPAENAEALAQAERDKKGTTRPGYVRRDLATTSTFGDVTYQAGANREVPKAFADHLDLINVSPDASTEANRKTKFGGGKENDQDAQGKSIKSAREGAPEAQRKHQQSDAFAPIAGERKSSSRK